MAIIAFREGTKMSFTIALILLQSATNNFNFTGIGQPFDCTAWTTTDGPGTFVQADTALNAIPGVDAANVRKIDD